MPASLCPWFATLVLTLAACGTVTPSAPPDEICASQARDQGGSLAAAFATNVGAVIRLAVAHETAEVAAQRPHQPLPRNFTGLSPDGAATLCYIDGVSIGFPFPSGEPAPRPWDRVAVVVVDGTADVVMAGYREQLPIQAP
ncbi:MAG: hypothetical protein ABI573_05210 [Chloroflexota bacterium]